MAPEEVGHGPACVCHRRIGFRATRERPTPIAVVVQEVVGDRGGDRAWHLGAAGTVEIRDRVPCLDALEGRKGRADVVEGPERSGVVVERAVLRPHETGFLSSHWSHHCMDAQYLCRRRHGVHPP